jgi:O-antigen ligase
MIYLLLFVVASFATTDILSVDLSLAPGLSAKNAILYLVGLCLAFQMVTRGNFKLQLPTIHAWFAVLIAYAILTWLIAGLIIRYQNYELLQMAITLKTDLIDGALVFALFFYGARTIRDGIWVTKALVIALTLANAIAIGNVEGVFNIGVTEVGTIVGEAGRVFGTWANANGTAALIVCLLPAYAAAALSSRGAMSVMWLLAAVPSAVMLIMTGSRGGYVGMLVGSAWAAYSLRRYLSSRQIMLWAGAGAVLLVVAALLAGSHFIDVLNQRLITQSGFGDLGGVSAGRTTFWTSALDRMLIDPVSLITGFGWDAYTTMGFYYAPHNHYLWLYFNLGLVGLVGYVLLVRQILVVARSALENDSAAAKPYLMAFVFGFSGLLVAIFFAQIFRPWVYIWAYVGVTMRMALCTAPTPVVPSAVGNTFANVPRRDARSAAATVR